MSRAILSIVVVVALYALFVEPAIEGVLFTLRR